MTKLRLPIDGVFYFMEIFKDIPGYEGLYQVSNLGNVKSLSRQIWNGKVFFISKDKILKPGGNGTGYLLVMLRLGNNFKAKTLHSLVAETFLNHNKNNKRIIVDHINGDRSDNRLENLQVITQRENTSKDKKNKTSKYTGVCWNRFNNKWMSGIRISGKKIHLGYFKCEEEANKAYQNKLKEILC
jgi:hypothetical protein